MSGHNHAYERLRPMIYNGTISTSQGIHSTIVGTGGRSLIQFSGSPHPGRVAHDDDHFGFLELALREDGTLGFPERLSYPAGCRSSFW